MRSRTRLDFPVPASPTSSVGLPRATRFFQSHSTARAGTVLAFTTTRLAEPFLTPLLRVFFVYASGSNSTRRSRQLFPLHESWWHPAVIAPPASWPTNADRRCDGSHGQTPSGHMR